MTLDYTDPDNVVNFRDVGEFVNCIACKAFLPTDRLYRGGTIRYVHSLSVVGSPKTIICLQNSPDPSFPGTTGLHFPISNDYEKYQTTVPAVRQWLSQILGAIARGIEPPLFVHCLSGKDRTGVVVATLLHVLGVPNEIIVEEYLLSDGEVNQQWIRTALAGLSPVDKVFSRVDLDSVRRSILSST